MPQNHIEDAEAFKNFPNSYINNTTAFKMEIPDQNINTHNVTAVLTICNLSK